MNHDNEIAALAAWVQQQDANDRFLHAHPLDGGVSSRMLAFTVADENGRSHTRIARSPNPHVLAHNPHAAAAEAQLLTWLHAAGLPVPQPLQLLPAGALFAAPTLILPYLDGAPIFAPANRDDFLQQQAALLARIHRLPHAAAALPFLPRQADRYTARLQQRPPALDDTMLEKSAREALAAVWPLPNRNPARLLHGDFWLGNLLWQEGRLTAVLDWEDAAIGDPLIDLAICRLEMTLMLDEDAADTFTAQYHDANPLDMTDLPYWDLTTVLRGAFHISNWAADAETAAALKARQRAFHARALAQHP